MHSTHTVVSHDQGIRTQLNRLKDTFFEALRLGHSDLKSFSTSWKSFLESVAEHSTALEAATHSMVSSFAQVVVTLATTLIDAEAIHHELEAEIASLAEVEFKKLSIHDSEPMPEPTSSAKYIEQCYMWLLAHLHNPYPPKSLRLRICQDTGSSPKDVDAWFKSARKNIGWNDIRRAHFETRFDMIRVATRHFKPTARTARHKVDNGSTLDEADEKTYDYQFADMQSRAHSLYGSKFFPTTLALSIEDKVGQSSKRESTPAYPTPGRSPSTTPAPVSSTKSKKRRHSDVETESFHASSPRPQRPLKRYRVATPSSVYAEASSSFPSPAPSRHRDLPSYAPSPAAMSSPAEDLEAPPAHHSRKRRRSDATDYDSDSSRAPRTQRRRITNDEDSSQSIPSLMPAVVPQVDPKVLSSASQTLKRKRRLSDAQDDRPRKHPHPIAIPRLHTVSNPLPAPSPFSDFDDIPVTLPLDISPAEEVNFSDMQNLDIEAFDYDSLPIMNEYLSQLEKSSKVPDYEEPFSLSVVGPEGQPFGMQGSGDDLFPFLDFNLPTSTDLSLPLSDNLFPANGITAPAVAPELWSTSQFSTSFAQTFDPTFTQTPSLPPTQPSGVNPFDLLLHPSANTQSPHIGDSNFDAQWDPTFGTPSQTTMALQKIQSLQAELDMCKTQLAQQGVFSF